MKLSDKDYRYLEERIERDKILRRVKKKKKNGMKITLPEKVTEKGFSECHSFAFGSNGNLMLRENRGSIIFLFLHLR